MWPVIVLLYTLHYSKKVKGYKSQSLHMTDCTTGNTLDPTKSEWNVFSDAQSAHATCLLC